jgi:hypothetical protein
MNLSAIRKRSETSGVFSSIRASLPGALAALAFCAPVHAESSLGAAGASCSHLGNDFVSVSGASGCVRIGGHVRAAKAQPAPLGYAETQDGMRRASEAFHVRAGAPSADAALYRR